MPEAFETQVDIDAPPDEVFRHLVDPKAMVTWIGQHAVLEAHPGGRFEIDVNGVPVRGEYVAVEPPSRVVRGVGVEFNRWRGFRHRACQ